MWSIWLGALLVITGVLLLAAPQFGEGSSARGCSGQPRLFGEFASAEGSVALSPQGTPWSPAPASISQQTGPASL